MKFILFQAKQRATVKWMLSKAFNNHVPENLKEPFYRDHEVNINSHFYKIQLMQYSFTFIGTRVF